MNDTTEDFFAPYDDIALEVCDNPYPNTDLDLELSNTELCCEICDLLGVEYFDMFEDLVPAELLKSKDMGIVRAHAFIYLLRWQTFVSAKEQGIGTESFNEAAIAHSELWYIRLSERYVELSGGVPDGKWVN